MRAVALALSVLLHALLLLAMLVRFAPTMHPKGAPVIASIDREVAYHLLPSEQGDGSPCDSYAGIGVMTSAGGFVLEVAFGGPAHRLGVKPGDWIMNADEFWPGMFDVGKVIRLVIRHNGVIEERETAIGRICQERRNAS